MSTRQYAAVISQAWMNEGGFGVNHYLQERRSSFREAQRDGIRAADGTDDFLVATIVGREMTGLTAADGTELDGWDADSYDEVADQVGLRR